MIKKTVTQERIQEGTRSYIVVRTKITVLGIKVYESQVRI